MVDAHKLILNTLI